jgi:hypothetical protein
MSAAVLLPGTTRVRRAVARLVGAALVAVAVLVRLVRLPQVQRGLASRVLEGLGARLGSDIAIGSLRVNLLTGAMGSRDLELRTPAGEGAGSRVTVDRCQHPQVQRCTPACSAEVVHVGSRSPLPRCGQVRTRGQPSTGGWHR